MKSITQISSSLFMIAALATFSAGCSVENSSTDAEGDEDTGEVENIPDTDDFQVMVNTNDNYQVVISEGGDGSTPCIAEEGEDILCVVDMYELDMYMRGYTLNDALPADMCAYRGFYGYYYSIAPIGLAPTNVFYELDADGNLIAPATGLTGAYEDVTDAMSRTANDADIYYKINGSWYAHQELYTTGDAAEVADSPEDLRCPWDYSKIHPEFPNCCYRRGNYSVKSVEDTEISETIDNQWGGSWGNCLEGPAMDWADAKFDHSGIPNYIKTAVDSDSGINSTFPVAAPLTISSTLGRPQVYAASFYLPADHGSDVPEMTRVVRTIWGAGSGVVNNSAHIQIDCLNEAFEVKARIRVVARDWNDYSDLLAFLAGSGSASNANDTGTETEPTQSSGDDTISPAAGEINDFPDWHDISTNEASCEFALFGSGPKNFGLTNDTGAVGTGGSATAVNTTDLIFQYDTDDYLGFILDEPD